MLIGVVAVVLAGFIIICAAPFSSHCLYKTGGSLFLASGEAFEICWTCTVYIFSSLGKQTQIQKSCNLLRAFVPHLNTFLSSFRSLLLKHKALDCPRRNQWFPTFFLSCDTELLKKNKTVVMEDK